MKIVRNSLICNNVYNVDTKIGMFLMKHFWLLLSHLAKIKGNSADDVYPVFFALLLKLHSCITRNYRSMMENGLLEELF